MVHGFALKGIGGAIFQLHEWGIFNFIPGKINVYYYKSKEEPTF